MLGLHRRAAGALAPVLGAWMAGCLLASGPFDDTGASTGAAGTTSSTGGAGGTGGAADTGGRGGADVPFCGDGHTDPGEGCDDANHTDGDGCDECRLDCGCPGCEAGVPCAECGLVGGGASGRVAGAVMFKNPASQHCYVFMSESQPPNLAEGACAAWGGHLVAPSTQKEIGLLATPAVVPIFTDESAFCWTGGFYGGSAWEWSNEEDWLLAPEGPQWAPGNPSVLSGTDCVVMGSDGKLRDRQCDEKFAFMCERVPL